MIEKQAVRDLFFECSRRASMALDSFDNGDIDKCQLRVSQLGEYFTQAEKAFADYKALRAE